MRSHNFVTNYCKDELCPIPQPQLLLLRTGWDVSLNPTGFAVAGRHGLHCSRIFVNDNGSFCFTLIQLCLRSKCVESPIFVNHSLVLRSHLGTKEGPLPER